MYISNRKYIEDFCYDLNYTRVILYVGNVDLGRLRAALELSVVNKIYRLDYALNNENPAMKNLIFVENCDLHDLSWPVHEYIADGYEVYILKEEGGRYYLEERL